MITNTDSNVSGWSKVVGWVFDNKGNHIGCLFSNDDKK